VSGSGCDVGGTGCSVVVSGGATDTSVCAKAGTVTAPAEDSIRGLSVLGALVEDGEFAGSGGDEFGTESAALVTMFVDVAVNSFTTTFGTGGPSPSPEQIGH